MFNSLQGGRGKVVPRFSSLEAHRAQHLKFQRTVAPPSPAQDSIADYIFYEQQGVPYKKEKGIMRRGSVPVPENPNPQLCHLAVVGCKNECLSPTQALSLSHFVLVPVQLKPTFLLLAFIFFYKITKELDDALIVPMLVVSPGTSKFQKCAVMASK